MTEHQDISRPTLIQGEAVFTSYNGLSAEGSGVLSFVSMEKEIFEIRDEKLLELIPLYKENEFSFFVQKLRIESNKYWIFGIVQKIWDFGNRPGVLGSCVCSESSEFGEVLDFLNNLNDRVVHKFSTQWDGKNITKSERLNVLSEFGKPQATRGYKSEGEYEVVSFDEDIGLIKSFEYMARRISASNKVGRVFLITGVNGNIRMLDQSYINDVKDQEVRVQEQARKRAEERERHEAEQAQINRLTQSSGSNEQAELNEKLIKHIQSLTKRVTALEAKLGTKRKSALRKPLHTKHDHLTRAPLFSNYSRKQMVFLITGTLVVVSVLFLIIGLLIQAANSLTRTPNFVQNQQSVEQAQRVEQTLKDKELGGWPVCGAQDFKALQEELGCEIKSSNKP